jgi:hypothetical protein
VTARAGRCTASLLNYEEYRMRSIFLCLLICLSFTASASAQFTAGRLPSKNWVTFWGGAYLEPGPVDDPTSGTTWTMGSAFGGGIGFHRQVAQGLVLGLDASYAPSVPFQYTRTSTGAGPFKDGNAQLASAIASGRLQYGGGSALGFYLTGGAGGFFWGVPELTQVTVCPIVPPCDPPAGGSFDGDLALLTGAGLEYRMGVRSALFLEWGRWWIFHQRGDEVDDNTNKFTGVKFGGRVGI